MTLAGTSPGRRGQHLGDEERVAAGDAVQRARRSPPASASTAARLSGSRRDPLVRRGRDHAEQALQRLLLLVAEGQHEDAGDRARSAARRRRARRASRRRPSGRPRRPRRSPPASSLHQRGERVVVLAERVAQRAERARRAQVVAGGEQHLRTRLRGERAHEAGLADPRLPHDEHDRPRRPLKAASGSSRSSTSTNSMGSSSHAQAACARNCARELLGQLRARTAPWAAATSSIRIASETSAMVTSWSGRWVIVSSSPAAELALLDDPQVGAGPARLPERLDHLQVAEADAELRARQPRLADLELDASRPASARRSARR